MILFQLSLSGHMLRLLVMLVDQHRTGIQAYTYHDLPNFVSTFHSLKREGLATWEEPIKDANGYSPLEGPFKFRSKGRKFVYEITPKGRAALELAAMDLHQFIAEVTLQTPPVDGKSLRTYQVHNALKKGVAKGKRK